MARRARRDTSQSEFPTDHAQPKPAHNGNPANRQPSETTTPANQQTSKPANQLEATAFDDKTALAASAPRSAMNLQFAVFKASKGQCADSWLPAYCRCHLLRRPRRAQ